MTTQTKSLYDRLDGGDAFIVRLFKLGFARDVDLTSVCRLINKPQKVVRASVMSGVDSIGNQDISELGYSKNALLARFPDAPESEILVGVMHDPIENNYFSKNNKPNKVILSLHETTEVCKRADQSIEEYLAQSTLSEFLQLQFLNARPDATWNDLVHPEVKCCIFDLVQRKLDKAYKLRTGSICAECAIS